MKTLLSGNRYHLFFTRYPHAWLEFWLKYDYHNYIVSITILTLEIGFEWDWKQSRPNLKKNTKQFIILRNS